MVEGRISYGSLKGKQVGKFVVTEVGRGTGKDAKRYFCFCVCECGAELAISAASLIKRRLEGCGCYVNGFSRPKYRANGLSTTSLYGVFSSMVARCYNPKTKSYATYGERGITICDEWLNDFTSFYNWALANGYESGLTIDRIDGKGNYCPENCRFLTKSENSKLHLNPKFVQAFGESKTLAEWTRDDRCKSNYNSIRARIYDLSWEPEKAISTPVQQKYWNKEKN